MISFANPTTRLVDLLGIRCGKAGRQRRLTHPISIWQRVGRTRRDGHGERRRPIRCAKPVFRLKLREESSRFMGAGAVATTLRGRSPRASWI